MNIRTAPFAFGWVLPIFLCGNVVAQTTDERVTEKISAQPIATSGGETGDSPHPDSSLQTFDELRVLVAAMLRERLPEKYTNEKQWGKTKPVFDGIRLRREGLKLETERKWKQVNDGMWKRYEIRLPEARDSISVTVDRLQIVDDNRGRIELRAETPVHLFGRIAYWEHGVQVFSVNADANATVRIHLTADVGMKFDLLKLPPDLVLDPRVVEARIELLDFRLNRVSQLHGPLAKHLGEGLRETIDDRVAAANATLVDKLNRQIDKQRDRLRLSWSDTLSKQWSKWTSAVAVQNEISIDGPATTPR